MSLAQAIRTFTEQHILPNEEALSLGGEQARERLEHLQHQAQEAGLWGSFYPSSWGGKGLSLVEYQAVAEEEGRSEWGPAVFGAQATLDTHILSRFADESIQAHYLPALAQGRMLGAYGMSEPDNIGSVPSTITTQAKLQNGHWHIEGRKWFVSRAQRASFVLVVAKTDVHASADQALSIILVPMPVEGFSFGAKVQLLGRDFGQAELIFQNVRVPQHHLIGQTGQALLLMQERLKLGRTMNACHWVGLAQRCFELMCDRINSSRGQQAQLADKQLVRQHVFKVYQGITSARAHIRLAAQSLDEGTPAEIETQMAKVSASQVLSLAVDLAMQIFGAEGLSDTHPLSSIYRMARTTRILDGTDEVLINSVGKKILNAYEQQFL